MKYSAITEQLVIEIRNQAIENVCNKRLLQDGQLERTWNQDKFDLEFANLINLYLLDCIKNNH